MRLFFFSWQGIFERGRLCLYRPYLTISDWPTLQLRKTAWLWLHHWVMTITWARNLARRLNVKQQQQQLCEYKTTEPARSRVSWDSDIVCQPGTRALKRSGNLLWVSQGNQTSNRTADDTLLMRTIPNLSVNMRASGWHASLKTMIKASQPCKPD